MREQTMSVCVTCSDARFHPITDGMSEIQLRTLARELGI